MGYFNTIFKEATSANSLSIRYPYTIRNIQRKIDANKEAFKAFKDNLSGLSIKDVCEGQQTMAEALGDGQMGTSLLVDFIPQVFTDTIVQFGTRVSVARQDFPSIQQSTNSGFRHRMRFRHDSAGIYREGDTIQHAITKRQVEAYEFIKLADSMSYTREFLHDSPIDEIALDLAASTNKTSMLFDRAMWHEFLYWSDGVIAPEFTPYNFQQLTLTSGETEPTAEQILTAMEDAYLTATTRQEDQLGTSELKYYISPSVYAKLWRHPDIRRFDILGRESQILRSDLPAFFGVPKTVTALGYFDESNNWNYQQWDVLLVATGTAAIRTRTDIRIEPFVLPERQMEGWITSERIRPYILNPIRFIRISPDPTLPIKILQDVTYTIRDLSKSENAENMISITQ